MNNENQEPNPEDLRASWEFAHVSPLNDGRDYFHHDGDLWGVPRNADKSTPHFSEAENPEFWEVGLETHEMESIKRALEIAEKVARAAMTDAPKRFKNRADHEAFCTRVIALLTESKILSCTYEHPGYINVPLPNEHSLACGDMNGFWSVDFNDQDGSQLECGGSFSHTANPGANEHDVAELIGFAMLHHDRSKERGPSPQINPIGETPEHKQEGQCLAHIGRESIGHGDPLRPGLIEVGRLALVCGWNSRDTGGGCDYLEKTVGVEKRHYAMITTADAQIPDTNHESCTLGFYLTAQDHTDPVCTFICPSVEMAMRMADMFEG